MNTRAVTLFERSRQSNTSRKAGGLLSGAASKAVTLIFAPFERAGPRRSAAVYFGQVFRSGREPGRVYPEAVWQRCTVHVSTILSQHRAAGRDTSYLKLAARAVIA
jgi:hypothetical protein